MIELHTVLTRKLGRTRADAEASLEVIDLPVMSADAPLVRRAASTPRTWPPEVSYGACGSSTRSSDGQM